MAVKLPGVAEALPVPQTSGIIVRQPESPVGAAIERFGQQLTGAGTDIADAFAKEEQRINKVRTEDAFTELRNKQIDLSIGQEDGFSNLKSGDAVKRPILKEWSDKFDTAVSDITSKLSNEEQRQAFKRRADVARSQYTQDILQHLSRENSVYQTQVMDSTVEAERNAASMHWSNPADAMASIERVKRAVDTYADANGIDGKLKQTEYQKRVSKIHMEVIGQAMNNSNPEYAELWFKTHRKEMTADAAKTAEKLMKENGTRIKSQRAVDNIMLNGWDEQKSIDYARNNFKGEERDDIIARINKRYAEIDAISTAQKKQAEDSAWKIVVQPNSSIDSIPPTLWSSMSGEGQKQITDYLRVRDTREARKEDDWDMLDNAEHKINVGDITDPSQLAPYEPYLKDSTYRSLRRKIEKRGTVSATLVQRSFEDRVGKTRSKWSSNDKKAWIAYQEYILENVKETKRPEDIGVWADKWFMEGRGRKDELFTDDPNTYGEARIAGRTDFLIATPDEDAPYVSSAMDYLRRSGQELPESKDAQDAFYTRYYLDATRWFATRDIVASPERIAAFAALKSDNKQITEQYIDMVVEQLK